MPVNFTVSEAIELVKWGKFSLVALDLIIPAAVTDPVVAHVPISEGYRILTERFNWGGTDIPDMVAYELWDENGFYCGNNIRQSNIDNRCTHLFSASFIDLYLWNITPAPRADVYVDFACWYFTYREENHERVMAVLQRKERLLEKILETLNAMSRKGMSPQRRNPD